jgi:hypothetical protein
MWGTTSTGKELTGNFGDALEDTSIGDCRLFRLFARNQSQGILGLLQHYLPTTIVPQHKRASSKKYRALARELPTAACGRSNLIRLTSRR